jgi:hypothetical protein
MPPGTPPALVKLAQDCWMHAPDARPSFEQVVASLEALQAQLSGGAGEAHAAELRQQGFVKDF